MRIHFAAALLCAGALAGCSSTPLTQLQESTPKGTAVSQALAGAYADFAKVEVTEMVDLKDGDYFARKGLDAARGCEPVPEVVADWDVEEKAVVSLQSARNRLAAALVNRLDKAAPSLAAKAQVGFDCWIEQQEEGFQPGDIENCRKVFVSSVSDLEQRDDYPHSVFFELDADGLSQSARQRIEKLAARAMRLGVPRITIVGHADSTGNEDHNLALSLRRADVVEQALVAAGVPSDRVGVAAAGENRLRVMTDDGVAEPQNRRVELLFQPVVGW